MPDWRKTTGFAILLAVFALLFSALGVWQVQRLQWKLALIASVDRKLAAAPIDLPGRARWASLASPDGEYEKVRVSGRYRNDDAVMVDALTALGPGFWVMTPLDTGQGPVWINRGFVPKDRVKEVAVDMRADVPVTGLVRQSEPGGRLLRPNRPAEGRWFSRDVRAMSEVRKLEGATPFFLDAVRQGGSSAYPVGGMTVTTFRNAHLVYAVTWFCLAAMSLFGLWRLRRGVPASADLPDVLPPTH